MHVEIATVAARQHGTISWTQLRRLGLSPSTIQRLIDAGWLVVLHDGVFAVGWLQPVPEAAWMAATLTAKKTFLSHVDAVRGWQLERGGPGDFVVVTRPGSGGPRRHGPLLVCRSQRLEGETTVRDGIPIVRAGRAIVDIAPYRSPKQVDRLVREALRRGAATHEELHRTVARHRGRRGIAEVRLAVERHAGLPLEGRESDAEALAVVLLHEAGRPAPEVNAWISGEEADLSWPEHRVIVELDGGQFHLFPEEDRRKEAVWRSAGWTVRRLPTDDVYDRPEQLLALAPR